MSHPTSAQSPSSELQFDLSPDDQALFLAEVDELLQRVEEALVDLERQPDDQALLQEIFRAAHTIKGSSATIGHIRMAALTHAMETRLDDVRKGVAPVTPGLIEALLKALDVLEVLRDEVETRVPNAVDHGLEPAEERLAVGKPAAGSLRLTASHADSFILITLEDDGRGINTDAVKRKAVERGAITQEQADRMTEQEACELIFAPGLSTARELSDVSGRGVGMDIVRANVEKINGSVEVVTRRGQGTTFTIRLPLTLAIVQSLLVRVAGGIYALPIHAVTETLRIEPDQVHRVNHREAIQLRGTVLPLIGLREVFGMPSVAGEDAPDVGGDSRLVVAVHTTNSRQVGLIVDSLVGEQEIVIKPLGQLVGDVAGFSGAAILGDGSVALIVDVAALIAQAIRDNTTIASTPALTAEERKTRQRRGGAAGEPAHAA